jgi:hypothetical protein
MVKSNFARLITVHNARQSARRVSTPRLFFDILDQPYDSRQFRIMLRGSQSIGCASKPTGRLRALRRPEFVEREQRTTRFPPPISAQCNSSRCAEVGRRRAVQPSTQQHNNYFLLILAHNSHCTTHLIRIIRIDGGSSIVKTTLRHIGWLKLIAITIASPRMLRSSWFPRTVHAAVKSRCNNYAWLAH